MDHQGVVPCPDCHRTFSIGQDPLLADEPLFDGAAPKRERALLEPSKRDPLRNTAPPLGFDFARLGDGAPPEAASLGGRVAESAPADAPVDLSVLMDAPARPGRGNSVINLGDLTAQPAPTPVRLADEEDDTRVLDIAAPGAWRARTGRGVIYELISVDAVVAWLEGKEDLGVVRIARGAAEFLPVDAHPELAARLGQRGRPQRPAPRQELELRLDDRPERGVEASPAREREVSPLRGADPEAPARRAAAPEFKGRALGFGTVLAVTLTSAALVVGTMVIGMRTGFIPMATAAADVVELGPPAPELVRAIAAYDAGNFTAATEQLTALQGPEADPRVFRYLALAQARNQQNTEADKALAQYRRAMLRLSGEHGRQVRELRD